MIIRVDKEGKAVIQQLCFEIAMLRGIPVQNSIAEILRSIEEVKEPKEQQCQNKKCTT